MARKNLKVPESLFLALRDDKPDAMTWPAYLETRCLGDEHQPERKTDVSPTCDTDEIAAEVAERIDYAELSTMTAREIARELR